MCWISTVFKVPKLSTRLLKSHRAQHLALLLFFRLSSYSYQLPIHNFNVYKTQIMIRQFLPTPRILLTHFLLVVTRKLSSIHWFPSVSNFEVNFDSFLSVTSSSLSTDRCCKKCHQYLILKHLFPPLLFRPLLPKPPSTPPWIISE